MPRVDVPERSAPRACSVSPMLRRARSGTRDRPVPAIRAPPALSMTAVELHDAIPRRQTAPDLCQHLGELPHTDGAQPGRPRNCLIWVRRHHLCDPGPGSHHPGVEVLQLTGYMPVCQLSSVPSAARGLRQVWAPVCRRSARSSERPAWRYAAADLAAGGDSRAGRDRDLFRGNLRPAAALG
jgi:hypothetical protein